MTRRQAIAKLIIILASVTISVWAIAQLIIAVK